MEPDFRATVGRDDKKNEQGRVSNPKTSSVPTFSSRISIPPPESHPQTRGLDYHLLSTLFVFSVSVSEVMTVPSVGKFVDTNHLDRDN